MGASATVGGGHFAAERQNHWAEIHVVDSAVLKRFEKPDEVREMELGTFELVRLPGLTLGRATYQPGWKWSVHVGPSVGSQFCTVEHVGLVLAGSAAAAFADGEVLELTPGTVFHIPARAHRTQW